VFRATVRANENSDIETTVACLRARCESAGLASHVTEMIVHQARTVLESLVERGRQLSSIGSQMHVAREVAGDGYQVKLVFRAGDRRSSFQRLLDRLRGQ
jgi:GH35 family endo-1,4-beta-xylanase